MTTAPPPQNNPTPVPEQPEIGLKERFFRYFQHEITALQEQMERLKHTSPTFGERSDAIDHCLAGIDRLSQEVKDSSAYLPAYDLRTYSEAIKALNAKLQKIRTEFAPPKKFQFKSARKNTPAVQEAGEKSLEVPGGDVAEGMTKLSIGDKKTPKGQENARPEQSPSSTDPLTISARKNAYVPLPTASSSTTTSGLVTNISHCVVDLSSRTTTSTAPLATLTLKNIQDSLIQCPRVTGPIHITSLHNSVLVAACGQFRMHGSKDVDVYLHCSSRPIIEDCENIRFAPLPGVFMTPELLAIPNQYDQIDDFKWLKAEPSPHFALLGETERVGETIWADLVEKGANVDVDGVLGAVLKSK